VNPLGSTDWHGALTDLLGFAFLPVELLTHVPSAAFKSFFGGDFYPFQQSTAMIVGLLNYVWSNQSFYLLGIANTIALVISMRCWGGHGSAVTQYATALLVLT
jgi:hypothetical protein